MLSTENSHIGAFLKGHDGPGLQHIGLHTDDIVDTVRTLSDSGVPFRRPPDAYYDLVGSWPAFWGPLR